jgi:hypothetical protein
MFLPANTHPKRSNCIVLHDGFTRLTPFPLVLFKQMHFILLLGEFY